MYTKRTPTTIKSYQTPSEWSKLSHPQQGPNQSINLMRDKGAPSMHPFVPDQSKQTEELLRLWIESYSPSKRFYFFSSKLSKIIKENPFSKVSCLIHLSKLLGHTQTIPTQKHLFNRWRQHTGNLKNAKSRSHKTLVFTQLTRR